MTVERKPGDWSRSYWVLLINQVVVTGLVSLDASSTMYQAYQAAEEANLELPGFTELYYEIGHMGILLGGLLSMLVSLMMVAFRKRLIAIVIASISFFGCAIFLCGALFSSIAPLLVAIRDMLPPEDQW
jgi:hypothetical protein